MPHFPAVVDIYSIFTYNYIVYIYWQIHHMKLKTGASLADAIMERKDKMVRKMQKKICGALAVLLVLMACISPVLHISAAANFDDVLAAAMDIIQQNEGSYGSVNKDDNGALSVGWIQWHGNRALNLLKDIVAANPSQAKNILGNALYNEITTSTSWSTRTLTDGEKTAISALLVTSEGKRAQDNLASADISAYIYRSMGYGITSPSALVYLAELENQCGAGGAKRVINAAANLVGGDYGAITLDAAHRAALADSVSGKYETRRNKVYNYVVCLGWDDVSIAEGCEIWKVTTNLNVRSGPGTSHPIKTSLVGGSAVFITEKVIVNGSTWGESNMGWLHLGYCSYISGNIPSKLGFDPAGGSLGIARATANITNYNAGRPSDALSIFTSAVNGSNTGTNIYGMEAAVDMSGRVTAIEGYGNGNMRIPKGGFVVSGNGAGFSWIYGNVKVGDYIWADPASMTVSVFDTYEAYLSHGKIVEKDKAVGTLPTPVREGYVFNGWYTGANGGTRVTADTVYSERTCTTLYAQWRELQNGPIHYDPAGGVIEGAFTQNIQGIDSGRDLNWLVVFTKGETTGTNVYGSETVVEADGRVSAVYPYGVGNSAIPTGGFVLSGHNQMSYWLTDHIHVGDYVFYNKAAKTITVCSSEDVYKALARQIKEGEPIGGALPEAVREHYTFTGWYTADGTKADENTVVPAGGLTLTAGWKRISAEITLDPGEGSLEPIAKAQTKARSMDDYRSENALIVYTPSYGDYTGTNSYGVEVTIDTKTGKVISAPGYGVGNSPIPVGCLVLSGHGEGAWWLQENVALGDYVLVGNSLTVWVYTPEEFLKTNKLQVYHGDSIGQMPEPVLTDMDFIGWFTESGMQVTADTVSDFAGEVTLYARYTDPFYELTFENGIGSGGPENIKFQEGESITIPDTVPDGGCYPFLGWAEQANGAAVYRPGDIIYAGDSVVLYAVYEMEHGYTETCNAEYTGLDADGNCVYTYTCTACGYIGTYILSPESALVDSTIYETVNGDFLTAYISFVNTVPMNDYTYIVQYDPALMSFHSSSSNIFGIQTEAYITDGVGYVRMRLPQSLLKHVSYVKLFFSGVSGQEIQKQYITAVQQSGALPDGTPGAFCVSGHTTVVGAPFFGDVNGDGDVTMLDTVLLRRAIVGKEEVPFGDIDGDGVLTPMDASIHLGILLGRIHAVYEIS